MTSRRSIINSAVWSSVLAIGDGDAYDIAILNLTPWGYWKGTGASTTLEDFTGNGNDATLVNGSMEAWTGADGNDYPDGAARVVTTKFRPSNWGTDNITILMLCGAVASASNNNAFSAGGNAGATSVETSLNIVDWRFNDWVSSARTYRVETVEDDTTNYGIWNYGANEIGAGDIIACVIPKNALPTRYLNGANIGGNAINSPGTPRHDFSESICFGGGLFGRVAIFDRALSAGEIAALYAAAQSAGL